MVFMQIFPLIDRKVYFCHRCGANPKVCFFVYFVLPLWYDKKKPDRKGDIIMTREERNQASLDKIIGAGIREFGTYGYRDSSINRICQQGNISKGKLYHYFADKESLFYACVHRVYKEFIDFIAHYRPEPTATVEQNFQDYFYRQQYFFIQNPYYPKVLVSTLKLSNPPVDPTGKTAEYLKQYNDCTDAIIRSIFQLYSDRMVQDIELATEVTRVCIKHIRTTYGYPTWDPENLSDEMMEKNLKRFNRLLQLLLYGVMQK